MFSKACEHGIRAIVYIASQSVEGNRVKIGDVAKYAASPEAFTGKVLGVLVKHNIVNSHTGPGGGFDISSQQMKQTKISDIVKAIDGDDAYLGCVLGLSECSEDTPCPIHDKFVKVRAELRQVLETMTVYDLAMSLKAGKSVLKS